MNRYEDFLRFRETYPVFSYNSYHIDRNENDITLSFHFAIPGLAEFQPTIRINTENLKIVNSYDSPLAQKIVFSLGMTEAVSYFKAVCPPRMQVPCGVLTADEIAFWKKLYYNGLGELFHINGICVDKEDFLAIEANTPSISAVQSAGFVSSGKNIIPIGGGKDSAVTTELLKEFYADNLFFTVNNQTARTETVTAGGYGADRIIQTFRTIDPTLLKLNKEGFLNGHTPFSAIVAFLSLYCAYLTGADYIVLSNESSANEPSVAGSDVNHQYSKSFAFEADFQSYTEHYITDKIHYFSLLRPFSEFHIAKKFASLPQYHTVFRSCNAGSKTNTWCCNCAKCLFIYSILSPFLDQGTLVRIFGEDLLNKPSLLEECKGLVGLVPVKPFECVGTVSEIRYALALTAQRLRDAGARLPFLLDYFTQHADIGAILAGPHDFLQYNTQNSIPEKFLAATKEMYAFVTRD